MAALQVRRVWWTREQPLAPEPPLFRVLSQRWQPVVRTEHRIVPFRLALSANEDPPISRASFGPKRLVQIADKVKKSARTWNPWMMMK